MHNDLLDGNSYSQAEADLTSPMASRWRIFRLVMSTNRNGGAICFAISVQKIFVPGRLDSVLKRM